LFAGGVPLRALKSMRAGHLQPRVVLRSENSFFRSAAMALVCLVPLELMRGFWHFKY
jgi:hypothetical protein